MTGEKRRNMKTDVEHGDFDTVGLSGDGRKLVILDQTRLPGRAVFLELDGLEDIRQAIYLLKVRGAPAIGVAAAIGLYVRANRMLEEGVASEEAFVSALRAEADVIGSARPTAVNLQWALDRMLARAERCRGLGAAGIAAALKDEALRIRDGDIAVCRKLGEHGLALLEPGQGILTHCNAGRLATVRYGTATAPIYLGHERGYGFKVYADETRPLLQGARLTAFELRQAGIDVTLICDNMAATVMKQGRIQAVITGCDRLAANGDAANKIGTLGVAILAHHFGIPFYVAVPTSSIDFSIPDGRAIRIEERPGGEICEMWYSEPMAPEGVRTYNPAFDVTDADLVSGIITEYGVLRPPYGPALERLHATLRSRAEAGEGGHHV